MHGVLLHIIGALDGDDRRESALRDDGHARLLGVGLGQVGQGLGDGGDVGLGDRQGVRLRVRRGLALVADHVVPVRRAGVERVLEELGDEGRRDVDYEGLVVGGGFFAEGLDRWGADCGRKLE